MRHKTIQKLLSGYLDGELTPANRETVENHLAQCASCRRYVERLKLLLDQPDLTAFPRLTPDPFLPGKIRVLAAGKNKKPAGIMPHGVRLKPAFLALVCVAAFLLGSWLGNRLGEMSINSSSSSGYSGFILPDSTTTLNGIWVEAVDQLVGEEK